MTVSLTLGWWLLPLALTIAAIAGAMVERPGDFGGFIPSPMPLVRFAAAVAISVAAWIGYFLVAVRA